MSEKINSTVLSIESITSLEDLRKKMGVKKKYFYRVLFSHDKFYREIMVPKRKNGQFRKLSVPSMALKNMQRWILDSILYKISVNENATGFVPSRSIVTNAYNHLAKKYILKLDIKDFFPSIGFGKVLDVFQKLGFTKEISSALANICIYKDELPQGAPTSPYLANIICKQMDSRISSLCKKYKLNYTRYADDITISGDRRVFWIEKQIEKIVDSCHFTLNKEKTVRLKPGDRKRVTGIIVNEKISVPKNIKRTLRKNIYYIEKHGLDSHLDRIQFTGLPYQYIRHLYGIASFIQMVEIERGIEFIDKLNSLFSPKNNIDYQISEDDLLSFEHIDWSILDL